MRAKRDRPVTVRQTADTVRAEVMIGGRPAFLHRYVLEYFAALDPSRPPRD